MYSKDLRKAACRLYKRLCSLREVADLFGIGKSTLQRWSTQGIEQKTRQVYSTKVTPAMKTLICDVIDDNPFVTASALKAKILSYTGVGISERLARNAIKACGYTKKRCRSRGGRASKEAVEKYCKSAIAVDPCKCVFIDETYVQYGEHATYGYSKRGARTMRIAKRKYPGLTMTLAMTSDRLVHKTFVKGASNADNFLEFLRGLDAPQEATLVMDNVRFHHSERVRALCASRGWSVLYTPPYSPDFNPIENVFGFLKDRWRKSQPDGRVHAAFADSATPNLLERCVSRAWRLVSQVLETSEGDGPEGAKGSDGVSVTA